MAKRLMTSQSIQSVLIANRGEIACRIIHSAKKLAIKTIAVYSDIDEHALHVELADEAFRLGPAPSQESYLNQTRILDIANQTNVDAIHPGYGFLAENADFAQACQDAGVLFIGPSSEVIRLMGEKDRAKNTMAKAGVPVIPGYQGQDNSLDTLRREAKKIGYPVLLKAVAGGGGKGMRMVASDTEFSDALGSVQREAKAFFDNPQCFLEKFLPHARHIEVQVFADTHGKCDHLFERDCSLQRRHQKIIEEAPAPGLDGALRKKLFDAAIAACKAISYVGAGTIEFLVSDQDVYFMEMNTRLQVEHPVTEQITGVDCVAWQFAIAQGDPLPTVPIQPSGHAIEARLYAENPEKQFLPSSGKLIHLRFPKHCRVDTGVRENDTVSTYYDPMIAKLITWAPTRSEAIEAMSQALHNTQIVGCHTNTDFLKNIFVDKHFREGAFDTHYIDESLERLSANAPIPLIAYAYASVYEFLNRPQAHGWQRCDAWQLNLPASQHYQFDDHKTVLVKTHSGFEVRVDDDNIFLIKPPLTLTFVEHDHQITIFGLDHTVTVNRLDPRNLYTSDVGSVSQLQAPLPGTVVAIHVSKGDVVKSGQSLIVIEAMKMEHTIHAPHEGEISQIRFQVGDTVALGEQLIVYKEV